MCGSVELDTIIRYYGIPNSRVFGNFPLFAENSTDSWLKVFYYLVENVQECDDNQISVMFNSKLIT